MGKSKGGDKNASGGGAGAKGGKGKGDKETAGSSGKKNGLKIKIRHIMW